MPIFEYKCNDCKKEFEELVRNKKTIIKCPECNSKNTVKKVSNISNFQVNDSSCPSGTCGLPPMGGDCPSGMCGL
jgi:putative FmdB family regulatory protein